MKSITKLMALHRQLCHHVGRLAVLAAACCLCTQADAATITVTSSADAGGGTLREAITLANPLGGDTIDFAPGLSGATITLNTGELVINKNLTVTGLGATHLAILGDNQRVFHITGGAIVTISGLNLKGRVVGVAGANGTPGSPNGQDGGPAWGGAILEDNLCLLTLNYCHFAGCEVIGGAGGNAYYSPGIPAHGGNGGEAAGGAIYNSGGDLILYGCAFGYANSATGGTGGKGGCYGDPDSYGGNGGRGRGGALVTEYSTLNISIQNCTFAGNGAYGGAGGLGGDSPGGIGAGADGGDGGLAQGGAIFVTLGCDGCTGIEHTTISTNICRAGGGGPGGSGQPVGDTGADGIANGFGVYFNGSGEGNNTLPMDNTIVAASSCPTRSCSRTT